MSKQNDLLNKISKIEKSVSKHNTLLIKLFSKEYMHEFEVIDKLNQHPEGLTFKEWMKEKYDIDMEDC